MSYDPTRRRRSVRKGRERGCWVYLPGEALAHARIDMNGSPPFYRTWASRKSRGAVYVQLYETADNA